MTCRGLIATVILVAGCGVKPPADGTPAGATSPAAPALIATCCAHDEAALMEQIRRYEATPAGEQPAELAMVPFRTTSGITRRDRIVIGDAAAWNSIWPQIVGSHSPVPAVPRIDFDREVIVIASMGQRSSGGYSVTIDSAVVAGDTIRLVVTERSPGPSCMTTAALSSPVALGRVARPRVPIQFIEKTAVSDCG